MTFVTTNIRLSEEDYLRLKEEAAKKHKSLAAIIREKISAQNENQTQNILHKRHKVTKILNSKLKNFNVVQALREMRYEDK